PIMGEVERAGGRLPPGPTEFLVSSFPEALLAFPPPVSELDETPAHQVMRNLLVDSSQGDLQEKVSIGQLSERPGQVPYCLGQCLSGYHGHGLPACCAQGSADGPERIGVTRIPAWRAVLVQRRFPCLPVHDENVFMAPEPDFSMDARTGLAALDDL